MTVEPTERPEFGPFIASLQHEYEKREERRAAISARAKLHSQFAAVVADIETPEPAPELRPSQPEPSFWRAIFEAVGEMVTAIVRRDR